jgi:hypothetical protein
MPSTFDKNTTRQHVPRCAAIARAIVSPKSEIMKGNNKVTRKQRNKQNQEKKKEKSPKELT